MTRSLIEQWLPAQAVGAESLRERGTPKAFPPINFLHVWWARRPLAASRAAVMASILPAWPSAEEAAEDAHAQDVLSTLQTEFPEGQEQYHAWFLRTLGILGNPFESRIAIKAANAEGRKLPGNPYGYPRAFTTTPDETAVAIIRRLASLSLRGEFSDEVVLLDPFAGGGSIPFEAARLGCVTFANELNPVAAAILEGTVSLPAKLGVGFAKVISEWGGLWAARVRDRLDPYYPRGDGETIAAYIWAHTVPCPTSGRPTPLIPDFWLARGAGENLAIELDVDNELGVVLPKVVSGPAAAKAGKRTTYKNGTAESIWTGETFPGKYIQEQASEGRLGVMLLALCVTRPDARGRYFRAPAKADFDAIAAAEAALAEELPKWDIEGLIPSDAIPPGLKTDEPRRMGLVRWSDMFMPRQLFANVVILEEFQSLILEARKSLSEEDARALALYLAFAFDKMIDYNGRLSSWDSSRVKVRSTFDRHDYAFKWTCAEFDAANALVPWAVKNAVANHTKICALVSQDETIFSAARSSSAHIIRGSATNLPLPDGSVDAVVTDPPYYDNVMYAECSDYFYVWLKRSLRDTWPQYTDLVLTDKEREAVANRALFRDVVGPSRRGRAQPAGQKSASDLADERYEDLLKQSFLEAHRVLKPSGVLTVMFTHKRVDAWDTLGASLLDAGFSINASWPVHTESEVSLHQARKNSAASTIFLACRKRSLGAPAYWADIRSAVECAAEEAAARFAAEGMTGVDLTIATYGPVLSVLSENWPVYTGELSVDGQPEILRPDAALDLARERVASLKKRGLLGGRDVEFDRVTDWYLLAWSDFRAAEFPFDEARKLCIATHLEFDDLAKRDKIVKATSGSVTLLTPAQRRTAGGLDPDASSFNNWIDRLHVLMLIYDEDGLAAARAWLARTGMGEDPRFADLIQAALAAIPRVRDKGEFVRPEARILDSLRTALFDNIPLPVDDSLVPKPIQGQFEISGSQGLSLPEEPDLEEEEALRDAE